MKFLTALTAFGFCALFSTEAHSQCNQIIGYSQVGEEKMWTTSRPKTHKEGWFASPKGFESVAGSDDWQLLWHPGAGVDKWQDPTYKGWKRPIVSPCVDGSEKPHRILLSISGPYGKDVPGWVRAIEASLTTIRQKVPSAKEFILQPVVAGHKNVTCPCVDIDCRHGKNIRASWQGKFVARAVRKVAKKYGDVSVGMIPQVRTCADFSDDLGHLTPEGAAAAGQAIGMYYAKKFSSANGSKKPGK